MRLPIIHFLLLSATLTCFIGQSQAQKPIAHGKNYKQILAMGEMKWWDFRDKQGAYSNSAMSDTATYWAMAVDQASKAKMRGLSPSQQKSFNIVKRDLHKINGAMTYIEMYGAGRMMASHPASEAGRVEETFSKMLSATSKPARPFNKAKTSQAIQDQVATVQQYITLAHKSGEISTDRTSGNPEEAYRDLLKVASEAKGDVKSFLSNVGKLPAPAQRVAFDYLADRLDAVAPGSAEDIGLPYVLWAKANPTKLLKAEDAARAFEARLLKDGFEKEKFGGAITVDEITNLKTIKNFARANFKSKKARLEDATVYYRFDGKTWNVVHNGYGEFTGEEDEWKLLHMPRRIWVHLSPNRGMQYENVEEDTAPILPSVNLTPEKVADLLNEALAKQNEAVPPSSLPKVTASNIEGIKQIGDFAYCQMDLGDLNVSEALFKNVDGSWLMVIAGSSLGRDYAFWRKYGVPLKDAYNLGLTMDDESIEKDTTQNLPKLLTAKDAIRAFQVSLRKDGRNDGRFGNSITVGKFSRLRTIRNFARAELNTEKIQLLIFYKFDGKSWSVVGYGEEIEEESLKGMGMPEETASIFYNNSDMQGKEK